MSPSANLPRMEGEFLPSALTMQPENYMSDPQQVHSFPNAKYLDEIRVVRLIQIIMDKPQWRSKMKDETIWVKWKEEARTQDKRFRDEMFEYARAELEWLAVQHDKKTGIEPSGVDLVWRSDALIPKDVHERFHALVAQFDANIPEDKRDWHPGSDGKVLNLIHPSMYCLAYNKSIGVNGLPIPPPYPRREKLIRPDLENYGGDDQRWYKDYEAWQRQQAGTFWSERFQWLPAEFLVDNSGEVKFASYINNLVPSGEVNKGLYFVLAEIFSKAVPLLNIVLTDLSMHVERRRFDDDSYEWWKNGKPQEPEELENGYSEIDGLDLDWEERGKKYEEHEQKVLEWYAEQEDEFEHLQIPEFDEQMFIKLPLSEEKEAIDIRGHQVQVIVKVGSIELTPEKPSFDGGKWHVEGMANERIVATVIYYYDSENIEGDELMFRQSVSLDYGDGRFEQGDTEGSQLVFGIRGNAAMVQDAGKVKTPVGRVLCFPNLYQHCVPSFSLADKSKPGHRKILVFFLVDPFAPITSTAEVLPQERDDSRWRDTNLEDLMCKKLPTELSEMIMDKIVSRTNPDASWGMSRNEALENRLALMAERSAHDDQVDLKVFGREFNLCEH